MTANAGPIHVHKNTYLVHERKHYRVDLLAAGNQITQRQQAEGGGNWPLALGQQNAKRNATNVRKVCNAFALGSHICHVVLQSKAAIDRRPGGRSGNSSNVLEQVGCAREQQKLSWGGNCTELENCTSLHQQVSKQTELLELTVKLMSPPSKKEAAEPASTVLHIVFESEFAYTLK